MVDISPLISQPRPSLYIPNAQLPLGQLKKELKFILSSCWFIYAQIGSKTFSNHNCCQCVKWEHVAVPPFYGESRKPCTIVGRSIAIIPRLRLRPGLWNADGTLLTPAVLNLNAFMPMEHPIGHIVFSQVTKCTLIRS